MVKVVFFDLETTGLDQDCDIIQIGAVSSQDNATFSTFILPNKPMSESAVAVTGVQYDCEKKTLFRVHDGRPIEAKSREEGFREFANFLRRIGNHGGVILVAHNCIQFDAPVLMSNLKEENLLHEFKKLVYLFSDTFQEIKRRRNLPRYGSLSLQSIVKFYKLEHVYENLGLSLHDALGDALAVKEIAKRIAPGKKGVDWSLVGKKVDYYLWKDGVIAFPIK